MNRISKAAAVYSAAVFLFFGVSVFCAIASAKPSWYPSKACRDAWQGRDLARYDSKKDRDYKTYQARIKSESGVERAACYKDWTVLVYMAADNDLSPYALWDLTEMEGRFESGRYAGSTLKTDLVVQADTAGPTGVRRLHIFQREDRPYQAATSKDQFLTMSPAALASPVVSLTTETPGRAGMVDHQTRLKAFLSWGMKAYPAEHYMVVLWGHGQGWTAGPNEPAVNPRIFNSPPIANAIATIGEIPQPAAGKFGGLLFEPGAKKALSIPALRDVLHDLVETTLDGKPIDVYASDACLMQMTEVAYEIAPFTRFIAGSAQVQSYLGLPYRRLLYEINSGGFLGTGGAVGKADEPYLIARMLPRLAEASLDPKRGQQGKADAAAIKTFTMSSLSSAELRFSLAPALKGFAAALKHYLNEDPLRSFDLSLAMKAAPSFMGGGKELGSFLTLIELMLESEAQATKKTTPASMVVLNAIAQTRAALDRTVIERAFGTGYRTKDAPFHLLGYRALGIWIPTGVAEFQERSAVFQKSQLESDIDWQPWIKSALGSP